MTRNVSQDMWSQNGAWGDDWTFKVSLLLLKLRYPPGRRKGPIERTLSTLSSLPLWNSWRMKSSLSLDSSRLLINHRFVFGFLERLRLSMPLCCSWRQRFLVRFFSGRLYWSRTVLTSPILYIIRSYKKAVYFPILYMNFRIQTFYPAKI